MAIEYTASLLKPGPGPVFLKDSRPISWYAKQMTGASQAVRDQTEKARDLRRQRDALPKCLELNLDGKAERNPKWRDLNKRYGKAKSLLPTLFPSISAPAGTAVKGIGGQWHSGIYSYDIDHPSVDQEDAWNILTRHHAVVLLCESAGGSDSFCLVAGPKAATPEEHKRIWTSIGANLLPGGLAIAGSSSVSININRGRYLPAVLGLHFNPDAEPLPLPEPTLPAKTVALPPEPPRNRLAASAPTDNDRPLDQAIALEPADGYSDWLAQVIWLKAVGLTADQVEAWSSGGGKYQENEVRKRWEGLPDDDPAEAEFKIRGGRPVTPTRSPVRLPEVHDGLLHNPAVTAFYSFRGHPTSEEPGAFSLIPCPGCKRDGGRLEVSTLAGHLALNCNSYPRNEGCNNKDRFQDAAGRWHPSKRRMIATQLKAQAGYVDVRNEDLPELTLEDE